LVTENLIEVTLIGTGGGYGESIVLHLGNNNWIVVDSCIDPNTKVSLPLVYLNSRGVVVEKDVKLIICTHWHDDHIRGMSMLLKVCASAKFCFSKINDLNKFFLYIGIDNEKTKNETTSSSTIEFKRCIDIIKNRNPRPIGAIQDRNLWSDHSNNISSEIYSLSPSDFVIEQFDKELSTLFENNSSPRVKYILHTPNEKRIALLVKINKHSILFGADLEVSYNTNQKGWLCILDNSTCIKNIKASLFKIPHHGSKNGYHPRIWKEIIQESAVGKLTPWNKKEKLPKDEMIKQYLTHTKNLYITSNNSYKPKPKKRDHKIKKEISRFNNTLEEVKFEHGLITSTLNPFDDSSKWETKTIGSAKKLDTQ
jgi:beta-lactamase superfamily II metal-dependent hydrolase